MLIDFTVENYRSIKDPVTLSAVAQTGRATGPGKKASGRDYIKSDDDIIDPTCSIVLACCALIEACPVVS